MVNLAASAPPGGASEFSDEIARSTRKETCHENGSFKWGHGGRPACGAADASAQTMTNKQMISRLRQSGVQICINCERACARCQRPSAEGRRGACGNRINVT